mgnify:CR=1 FL=1
MDYKKYSFLLIFLYICISLILTYIIINILIDISIINRIWPFILLNISLLTLFIIYGFKIPKYIQIGTNSLLLRIFFLNIQIPYDKIKWIDTIMTKNIGERKIYIMHKKKYFPFKEFIFYNDNTSLLKRIPNVKINSFNNYSQYRNNNFYLFKRL